MTLQSTGVITAEDINIELGRPATAPFSLTGTEERELVGIPTGLISFNDFYGKSLGLSTLLGVRSISGVTGGFGYISSNAAFGPVGTMSTDAYKGVKILAVYSSPDNGNSSVVREFVGNLVNYVKPTISVKDFQGYDNYSLENKKGEGSYIFRSTIVETLEPSDASWTGVVDTQATIKGDLNLLFCSNFLTESSILYSGFSDPSTNFYGEDTFGHTTFYLDDLLYRVNAVYTSSSNMAFIVQPIGHSRVFGVGDFSLVTIQQGVGFSPSYPLGQIKEYLSSEVNAVNALTNSKVEFNFTVKERLDDNRPFDFIIQPSLSVGNTPNYSKQIETSTFSSKPWSFFFFDLGDGNYDPTIDDLIVDGLTYIITSLSKLQSGEVELILSNNGNPPLTDRDIVFEFGGFEPVSTFGSSASYDSGNNTTTFIVPSTRCTHLTLGQGVEYTVKMLVK